jgi:hypothetical protein
MVRERHWMRSRGGERASQAACGQGAGGGVHEGMTASRVPHQLTEKYEALFIERTAALSRIEELDRELDYLDYSLRLIAPDWAPAEKRAKKLKASRLPRGVLSRDCLHFLKADGELWTPELVYRLAQRHHLKFANREEEQDFASAVAMALRRYERQGALQVAGKDSKTQALRWRLHRDVLSGSA